MSDVHATYDAIREALMAGEEAVVEVTAPPSGAWSISWGVAARPKLRCSASSARLMAQQFRVSGWHKLADMLVTAAEYCDRHGPRLH